MKPIALACLALTVSLALASCNLPAPAQDSNALSTSSAQTEQAEFASSETPPAPQATEALATQALTATLTVACEDSATYTVWTRDNLTYDVKEVDKRLAPNTTFIMSWTLKNTGTCTWNHIYQMYFDSGTSLTRSANFPVLSLGEVVKPGETVTVAIEMTAPAAVGDYQTAFRLQNEKGESVITFGVVTKVGNAATQAPLNPSTLRYTYDCTTGSVNIGLSWVDRAADEDGYRIYRDGTKIADLASGSTTFNDIAPGAGAYLYTVSAFNSIGESPASVTANTSNCK